MDGPGTGSPRPMILRIDRLQTELPPPSGVVAEDSGAMRKVADKLEP